MHLRGFGIVRAFFSLTDRSSSRGHHLKGEQHVSHRQVIYTVVFFQVIHTNTFAHIMASNSRNADLNTRMVLRMCSCGVHSCGDCPQPSGAPPQGMPGSAWRTAPVWIILALGIVGGGDASGGGHDRHRWVVAPLLSRKEIILQEGGHEFSGIYISLNVKHPRHSFVKNGKRSMERFEGKKMASHLYHHSLRLPTLPPAP